MNLNFFYLLFFWIGITLISCEKSEKKYNIIQKSGSIYEEIVYENDSLTNEILDNWLGLFTLENEVIEHFGKPQSKGKIFYNEFSGTFIQDWNYETSGLFLKMESESKNALKTVKSINIKYPSKLLTTRNIGISSESIFIYENYKNLIDEDFSDERNIVIGNIYNGTIFKMNDGKVESIYIGGIFN